MRIFCADKIRLISFLFKGKFQFLTYFTETKFYFKTAFFLDYFSRKWIHFCFESVIDNKIKLIGNGGESCTPDTVTKHLVWWTTFHGLIDVDRRLKPDVRLSFCSIRREFASARRTSGHLNFRVGYKNPIWIIWISKMEIELIRIKKNLFYFLK